MWVYTHKTGGVPNIWTYFNIIHWFAPFNKWHDNEFGLGMLYQILKKHMTVMN